MESRSLFLVEERLKTFKNWPFDSTKKCNIQNMAEAGFYSVATSSKDIDAAKCFLCGKELDGWEPHDDPWTEHKNHAAKCAFVQLGKQEDNLLLSEFLSVMKQYITNETKRLAEVAKDKIEDKGTSLKKQYFQGR